MIVYYSDSGHAYHYTRDCERLAGSDREVVQTAEEAEIATERPVCHACWDASSDTPDVDDIQSIPTIK